MQEVKADILKLWEEKQLRITDEIQIAPEVLYANGSVIGTLGNFSASTGKAKSKKTFNVAAIVGASLVNGKVLGYTAEFPDDKRTILYFDTEQSPYHCQKVMERALRLAKLPTDTHPEHLKFAALRQLTPSLRLEVIEQAIINTPGVGLVVIDGVRDLMYDINCAKESTDLIGKLMEWTDKFQIHIHTVLHLNKSDDNARGHVGTELNNKAETVLQVSRSKTDDTVSEVCAAMIRAAEFDPFAFRVNDYGLPEIASGYVFTEPGKKTKDPYPYKELTEEQHREALGVVFVNGPIKGCRNFEAALKSGYAACGHSYSNNKVKGLKTFLDNKGMIRYENREYIYNPDFYY